MKKIISTEKKKIMLWLDEIDQDALQQAKNLANLPFTFHHVAIMPDAHVGYGMPIGGVLATRNVIIPNAVGVDIGCGVCAVKTGAMHLELDAIKEILKKIRKRIPVGKRHQHQARPEILMPPSEYSISGKYLPIISKEYKRALKQLGTLGGGNHFIELQKGSDNSIWLMVHSGSRNLGYKVASHYNGVAISAATTNKNLVPKKWDLAFLELNSRQGENYFREMKYCTDFAKANRSDMMDRIMEAFSEVTGCGHFDKKIDVAHNYASSEVHFGEEVVVHRKGATRAAEGSKGIIPGSQGSSSYIVQGLGNPDSFASCSHGAGRKYGRKQAQKNLDLEDEISRLNAKKIVHGIRGRRDLDEAPGAYKDIDQVMADQTDLVEIIVELSPLAVIKG